MRFAAVALLVFVVAGVASAQSPQPAGPPAPPSQITLAATVVDVRESTDMRSDIVLLWNRTIRSRPVGHAVLTCAKVGTGGVLGGGIWNCIGVYQLPLGKISTQGILHGYNRYTLVITGGTGRYKGVSGSLFVRRVAEGQRKLIFSL